MELLGTIVGLIYLWLEYKASIYLWIAGIVMPAIYLFVYYEAGLYADFGINVYYLLAAVYGWIVWRSGKAKDTPELPITHMPRGYWLPLFVVFALVFVGIAWLLITQTDSTVPWADSFTTALSIVGMWMLARKYLQQWWVWIVVDAACSALYIYKELYFTAVLYALYAIIAIFGYFKWKKMMERVLSYEC